MTRSELIRALGEKFPQLTAADIEEAVVLIINTMVETLEQKGRIEIRGFGSFSPRYREPCKARNPKTGEAVDVPGKYYVHYKAGKEQRDRVDS